MRKREKCKEEIGKRGEEIEGEEDSKRRGRGRRVEKEEEEGG